MQGCLGAKTDAKTGYVPEVKEQIRVGLVYLGFGTQEQCIYALGKLTESNGTFLLCLLELAKARLMKNHLSVIPALKPLQDTAFSIWPPPT